MNLEQLTKVQNRAKYRHKIIDSEIFWNILELYIINHSEVYPMIPETRQRLLLDLLRQSWATVSLKAVLTEHNAQWSSEKLHHEISLEHAAMQGLRSAAPRKSVHRKK